MAESLGPMGRQSISPESSKDLVAAQELIAKVSAELDAAKGAIARDTATAHRLAGQIEADQTQLQRLLATLRSNQPGVTNSTSSNLAPDKGASSPKQVTETEVKSLASGTEKEEPGR